MNQLVSALDDSLSGDGHIVAIVGEPGIGKTRTAQQLVNLASARGACVLWGRCYEEGGAPSYWPWIQSLRTYIDSKGANELEAEMGNLASSIAEIIPDIKQKLPDIQSLPLLEPEQARFRVFDAIATFLKRASETQPITIVLDDLHWADKSSLMLLEFIGREISNSRLLIVCTYRDVEINRQHPLADTLGNLIRETSFERVLLRGITKEDVATLIEVTSGITPSPALADLLHTQTEGNPLFVSETIRLLTQENRLNESMTSLDIRIPEGVREVIGRRLNRLSSKCNEILTVASVLGREFQLQQLSSVLDEISQNTLLDLLEEGLQARVIEELPDDIGYYQFSHVLIQETLSGELSLTRRTRLHALIAERLEVLYETHTDSHAAELAHHFAQAKAILGTEKLLKYSIAAGERAMASYAYEEAQVQFQRALDAKEDTSSLTNVSQSIDAETASILFGLGQAQVATFTRSQAQEAVDTLRRAFDALVELGDTENAVAVATYPHGFLRSSSGDADMTARALELVSPDSIESGHIFARYGSALSWEHKDYEGAQVNLDRAVEIARKEGDRVLEVRAFVSIALMYYDQCRFRESVENNLLVIELAQSLGELDTLVHARLLCANALLSMGHADESLIHATAGLEEAERLHNRGVLVALLRHNAYLSILKGDWNDAQGFVARALAESPQDIAAVADGALLNLQLGNFEESNAFINQLAKLVSGGLVGTGTEQASAAVTMPLSARVTGATDLLDVAESAAREILRSPSLPSMYIVRARAGLALIAIQKSDKESAEEQYSFLKSQRGTQLFAVICYDHLLGLLAQTIGNLGDAQAHFEDALAFCRNSGFRTELAWSIFDYAVFRQAQGERDMALTLLEESFSIATELGMRPLVDKASALKEQIAPPDKPASYPGGLTEREVEILRLVASGKSNPEIAEELFISPRTVTTHVSNILNKTDSSNRAEAAIFASQNGLL